jgi:hypothetical protein
MFFFSGAKRLLSTHCGHTTIGDTVSVWGIARVDRRRRGIVGDVGYGAAVLIASALLAGCGDRSEPFALPDGCYYADDGTPILKVRGEEGLILTPAPARDLSNVMPAPVRRVRLNPRRDGDRTYVEMTPGILLGDYEHRVQASGQPTARFLIRVRPRGPAILVPIIAYGEMPIMLGRAC